jgi:hypothetical protein
VEEKRERAKRARRASLRQNAFMVMILPCVVGVVVPFL